PAGVVLQYYFKEAPDSGSVALRILEQDGSIIKSFNAKAKNERGRLSIKEGMNRFVWNMRYADAESFKGLIMWAGSVTGPKAAPGNYQARLVVGVDSTTVPFEILKDPRSSSSGEDLKEQFNFLIAIRDKLSETHTSIKQIRDIKSQVKDITSRLKGYEAEDQIKEAGKALTKKVTAIETALYQTKNKSRQDPLNFPIRLNNKLAALASLSSRGDFKPTDQAISVKEELTAQIDVELAKLREVISADLPAFNQLVREHEVPAVMVEMDKRRALEGTNED
ncbi:glycosyl hydrolase, partial [bacterium]|nr:glycosyl hydrolase [bacterium]